MNPSEKAVITGNKCLEMISEIELKEDRMSICCLIYLFQLKRDNIPLDIGMQALKNLYFTLLNEEPFNGR